MTSISALNNIWMYAIICNFDWQLFQQFFYIDKEI